jgi:type I restriction enzyme S subunit
MFGDPVENEKGWTLKTMEDVCLNIVDCPHSTPKKSNRKTNYPCIRTSELKEGSIYWDSMQYLEEDEYVIRIARLKPIAGDIVFGREGTIGDAVILPDEYNFSLGQRTMLMRVDGSSISNIFLQRVILSECVKKQIRMVNVSSTVPHVNIKDFKRFEIPVPPLALQQSFAAKIESIEKQKATISKSIAETQKLFDYTMDKYFGE